MAYEDILEWSTKQNSWAQDALRRLVVSGVKLSNTEIAEVLKGVKHESGIVSDPAPGFIPIATNHLPEDIAVLNNERALLCSLSKVKNVNRLASDQTLAFATNGITLVYGDNGSGKSGYSRITKKLCRSIGVDNILGNVFDKGEKKKAELTVRYQTTPNVSVTEEVWQDGNKPPAAIGKISVFDAKNARLYVDAENRIQYLPPPISLMENYAALLRTLSGNIEGEIAVLKARVLVALPTGFNSESSIAKFLNPIYVASTPKSKGISDLPSETQLISTGVWSDHLQAELVTLERSLLEDPITQSNKLLRVSETLSGLSTELKAIGDALSADAIEDIKTKTEKEKATGEAATIAATQLFAKEPIQHTGTDKWRLMYDYATEFAAFASGTENTQPIIDEQCVLCQQPLSGEAKERLKKFDEFVANKASIEAKTAKQVLGAEQQKLNGLKIKNKSEIEWHLAEYGELHQDNKVAMQDVILFLEKANSLRASVLLASAENNFSKVSPLPENKSTVLSSTSETFKQQSIVLKSKSANADDRKSDREKVNALKDQKKLSEEIATFTARLKDLLYLDKLKKCEEALNTTSASRCITGLRRKLVTQDMQKRVQEEIANFELGHIPFEVNDRSDGGESYVGIKLREVIEAQTRDILSEGEQRALALACFLSEVLANPNKHGMIIDDPVSSLDHLRIRKIAERLVKEASTGRQVIIFTHNIFFYSEVVNFASRMQVPLMPHCIRTDEAKGCGLIQANDEPWIARQVGKRIQSLQELLPKFKNRTDTSSEEYRKQTKDFYTDLRETWERLVEEVLLAGVISRYNPDVKTQSLSMVDVTDDDYKTVYWSMTSASERSGHDAGMGRPLPAATYEDMKKALGELIAFRTTIAERKKQTETRRKQLVAPPKASVA